MQGLLQAIWRASPPAIWGKLPEHADFVHCGVRCGEAEGWTHWLAREVRDDGAGVGTRALAMPVAFVLPPGTLAFAPRRFVLGVIAPSIDQVGRHHPLLVYQQAATGWIRQHYASHAAQPLDWQFWLARAVARHAVVAREHGFSALQHTVDALWRLVSPVDVPQGARAIPAHRMRTLVDRCAGPATPNDRAARLHGVRHLPWADWPQRLLGARPASAFWQQDAAGGFVACADRLQALWSRSP